MSVMPVFNNSPVTSLMGVMLFPHDLERAHAFSSWKLLSNPLNTYRDDFGTLSPEEWQSFALTLVSRPPFDELMQKEFIGRTAGLIIKLLWGLICLDPKSASMRRAFQMTSNFAFQGTERDLSRAGMHRYLHQMQPVLHYWAALSMRVDFYGRIWLADPATTYDRFADLCCFVTEAELLRKHLVEWSAQRGGKHISSDYITVPEEWLGPIPKSDWPDTGKLFAASLPADFVPKAVRRGPKEIRVSAH